MDIVTTPATRTVTVLSVGFDDSTETSLVIDESAGDVWRDSNEDIVIHLAPKPEKHIVVKDRTGRERTVTIAAQPQKTIVWRGSHIKWLEWNTAQAAEYPAYQPKATSAA
jgi:hypothetical protein